MKKIGLASDHAGFETKGKLRTWLEEKGYQVIDFGCNSLDSCDYPDFAHPLSQSVSDGVCDVGISLCGSGNGINMVANKYPKIRSALCWNNEITSLARRHNDANICAIPARFLTFCEVVEITTIFLKTDFESGRHLIRINKIIF